MLGGSVAAAVCTLKHRLGQIMGWAALVSQVISATAWISQDLQPAHKDTEQCCKGLQARCLSVW